ncbi:MAG: hypothetical protein ACK5UE_06820 [Chitinophagales bacterium]|nr:hypothetical protein [Sphingobacteriales bacterium]
MLKTTNLFLALVLFVSGSLYSQSKEYDEEEVRKILDKYIENPKLYFEKIKNLNERADKANENTMKVSEEYLSLLDKKDSLLKIYKNKAAVASRMASTTSPAASTQQVIAAGSPAKPAQQTTVITKVQGKTEHTPYRVQLAAYFKEDFEKFFGSFNKTLGIQKLNNRNVIEVQGFKDEAEALEFSQKIQKLGFPGAFVTKYDENGERQEGFKTDNKFFTAESTPARSTPPQATKTSKNIQYPDYIPIGYKEHLKKNSDPALVKAPTATNAAAPNTPSAAPKAKSSDPVQLKAPSLQRDAVISSTSPVNTPVPQAQKPKALASAATVPSPTESAPKSVPPAPKPNTPPPVNKNSRDQLDAAFDQLFKR